VCPITHWQYQGFGKALSEARTGSGQLWGCVGDEENDRLNRAKTGFSEKSNLFYDIKKKLERPVTQIDDLCVTLVSNDLLKK
jgi:hypothetical protein